MKIVGRGREGTYIYILSELLWTLQARRAAGTSNINHLQRTGEQATLTHTPQHHVITQLNLAIATFAPISAVS